MSYNTYFKGKFYLDKILSKDQLNYINNFSETRRVKRDAKKVENLEDQLRKSVGLPVGEDGEFYLGDFDIGILDYNSPPANQPSLWCDWQVYTSEPEDKLVQYLAWNENEGFYNYVKWLYYLIEKFFNTWSIKLNGCVTFQGEECGDVGIIKIQNNKIEVIKGVTMSDNVYCEIHGEYYDRLNGKCGGCLRNAYSSKRQEAINSLEKEIDNNKFVLLQDNNERLYQIINKQEKVISDQVKIISQQQDLIKTLIEQKKSLTRESKYK